jgi:hypothetical protein
MAIKTGSVTIHNTESVSNPIFKGDIMATVFTRIPTGLPAGSFLAVEAAVVKNAHSDYANSNWAHVVDADGNVVVYEVATLTPPVWQELSPSLFAAVAIRFRLVSTALPSTWQDVAATAEMVFPYMGTSDRGG